MLVAPFSAASRLFAMLSAVMLLTQLAYSQSVCHTYDFIADEESWIYDDCGIVSVGLWPGFPDDENIIDITSSQILISDLEGGNCSGTNDGGDLQNFWTSIDIDVSDKCEVELKATYSFDNLSVFSGAANLECGCSCSGEDYLGFEFSIDGGSWQLFDPSTPNEICNNDTGFNHMLTTSSTIFGATTIAIRIQLASQSVSEAIIVNSVEIIDLESDPIAIADASDPDPVSYTHLTLPTTPYV